VGIVTSEPYTGLTLENLLRNIYFETGQVAGVTISESKFPRWYVIQKLNDRQNKFVYHSQCLKKVAIIGMKADFKNYKLPQNCMDNGIIGMPKYYDSATDYRNLEIKDTIWLDEHHQGWDVADSGDPIYAYRGNSFGNSQMMGVYPAPDVDGTSYLLSPDPGIIVGEDFPGTTTNISGTATGGNATTLTDTACGDFRTIGLIAGMAVLNTTDGSQGVILTIAEHSITLASALTGGSANVFGAGDTYNILAGEYGIVTSWSEEGDIVIFSSEVGAISNITIPAGNIKIDFIPYPIPFPATGNDDQYPEIPKLYHMDYAMGVVADLLRTFTEGTKEFQRAQYYEAIFDKAVAQAKAKKDSRPYDNKPVKLSPVLPFRRNR
jgi:hypothetical protein